MTTLRDNGFKQDVERFLLRRNGRSIPYGLGCAWLGRSPEPDQIVQRTFCGT